MAQIHHQKHGKIVKPQHGRYGRHEWAIVGTPCGNIQRMAAQLQAELQQDFVVGYMDADHNTPEDAEPLAYMGDKLPCLDLCLLTAVGAPRSPPCRKEKCLLKPFFYFNAVLILGSLQLGISLGIEKNGVTAGVNGKISGSSTNQNQTQNTVQVRYSVEGYRYDATIDHRYKLSYIDYGISTIWTGGIMRQESVSIKASTRFTTTSPISENP